MLGSERCRRRFGWPASMLGTAVAALIGVVAAVPVDPRPHDVDGVAMNTKIKREVELQRWRVNRESDGIMEHAEVVESVYQKVAHGLDHGGRALANPVAHLNHGKYIDPEALLQERIAAKNKVIHRRGIPHSASVAAQQAREQTRRLAQDRSWLAQKVVYPDDLTTAQKQLQVRDAVKHSWDGYRRYAFGKDKLIFHAIDRGPNPGPYGTGGGTLSGVDSNILAAATTIDSIDVLKLVGLDKELAEARQYVVENMHFDEPSKKNSQKMTSLFEVTIRVLGGLLSANALTGDRVYLDKAVELGDRLLPAFKDGHMPCTHIHIPTGNCMPGGSSTQYSTVARARNPRSTTIGQAGTLLLEFRQLSAASGDARYGEAAGKAERLLIESARRQVVPYVLPQDVDPMGNPRGGDVSVDGEADSYWEYLLKLYLQGGKEEAALSEVFERTVDGLHKVALGEFPGGTFVGRQSWPIGRGRIRSKPMAAAAVAAPKPGAAAELNWATIRNSIKPVAGHLSCFWPGVLALSTRGKTDPASAARLAQAEAMMATCYQLYNKTFTGIGGEYFDFRSNFRITEANNRLRPEVVESLMVLWRITKNQRYRDWGWQIFSAFQKYARHSKGGFCALNAVTSMKPQCPIYSSGDLGAMPSFWIAETLKYLYLLFEDDPTVLSFDDWVFNTEAHPFPINPKHAPVLGPGPWSMEPPTLPSAL